MLATSVLFMFFKMYHREAFGELFYRDNDLHGYLEIPLTFDDSLVTVPKELREKFDEVLENTPKNKKPAFDA